MYICTAKQVHLADHLRGVKQLKGLFYACHSVLGIGRVCGQFEGCFKAPPQHLPTVVWVLIVAASGTRVLPESQEPHSGGVHTSLLQQHVQVRSSRDSPEGEGLGVA